MGSSHTQELALALARMADKASLRPAVIRLTASIKERSHTGTESSLEFVKSGVSLLKKTDWRVCTEDCYESMAEAAQYLFAHGEFGIALDATDLMCRYAVVMGNKGLQRQAENYTAIIEKHVGNFADSLVHTQHALTLAQEIGDRKAEALMLGNLGLLLYEIGSYEEAEACMRRGLFLMEERGIADERGNTYHNLATLLSRVGKRDAALIAAQESLRQLEEPQTVKECHTRALREASYIYLTIEDEDLGELKRHLELCRTYAARSSTRPAECVYTLASAMVTIRESHDEHAIDVMRGALEIAQRIGLYGVIEDALASLAWAHEIRGEFSEALGYVRRLIEHVAARRHRCLEVLEASPQRTDDFERNLLPLKYRLSTLEAAASKADAQHKRIEMLERLAVTASMVDDPSGMHGHRVGKLSRLLASAIGWGADRSYQLEIAARLHDIGKTAIPGHILLRSSALKNAERDFIRAHPQVGAALLTNTTDAESALASDVALCHHEWWDGTGYPNNLAKARIPEAARIVAIADVFDALTHGRPYAAAWPVERALSEIRSLAGFQFDPGLVEPFVSLIGSLRAEHPDLDVYLEATALASPFFSARKKIQAMIVDAQQKVSTAAD